ncbi:uncharacterized protein [Rutidosis leptorrhynchoides]|uniref:uncharacterized protein n=1 Tax=Rutidosis leptorrhynchoides TaxID=125765 RepID=UPI003A993B2C
MRRGHTSNSFTRSGNDQHDRNHTPTEQPFFPTGRGIVSENGVFVGQMNHIARGGVPENRANEYPSSNVGMEIQPYVPAPPVEPYSHSSITEDRSSMPVGHAHCTSYSMRDAGNGGPLKRKRSGSFYSAGSSSSSSQMPLDKDCLPYRSSLTIGDEDSSRNVRRRYRLDLEPSMTRPHVPSHFYHSAPGQHTNLDPNGGHWNGVSHYAFQRRISPSDVCGSRHEMNQFHIGASSADRDPYVGRYQAASSSSSHAHSIREEHAVNHFRRSDSSHEHGSRYSHYARGATSSTNGLHALPDYFSSRNSRHYSHGGWRSSYRSGRPRLAVDRFAPVTHTTESHDRMGHESIMMGDRASFYPSSRNFSDQYRDLRLDIDSMSYEELLNLEERIGSVSTGLSENSISKFLKEKVYSYLDQDLDEVSCPICLEEYKSGDKIGKMEICGHDYHVDCIKKWLFMKKLCPICKTECSN